MHAIEIHDRTRAIRARFAEISEEIRSCPPWRKAGEGFERLLAERSELLKEIDRMSRPTPAPGPKSDGDRARDAKAIRALVKESADEKGADRAKAKSVGR